MKDYLLELFEDYVDTKKELLDEEDAYEILKECFDKITPYHKVNDMLLNFENGDFENEDLAIDLLIHLYSFWISSIQVEEFNARNVGYRYLMDHKEVFKETLDFDKLEDLIMPDTSYYSGYLSDQEKEDIDAYLADHWSYDNASEIELLSHYLDLDNTFKELKHRLGMGLNQLIEVANKDK